MFQKIILRAALALLLGILCATAYFQNDSPVSAAPDGLNFTVNDTADLPDANPGDGVCAASNGNCTLRAAIMEANKHPGTDIVSLQANTTYTLTRAGQDDNAKKGDLDVRESIDLRGNGATIDGNSAVTQDRVLHFPNMPNILAFSQLSDLTITGGSTTTSGGGILANSFVILRRVTVTGNHADAQGGGIANQSVMALRETTVEKNDCTCASDAQPGGGGIANHGALIIERSTISENVSHFDGGGIWSDGDTMEITTSTIALNQTDRHGGGLYLNGGENYLLHSTIGFNVADYNHDDVGFAGGIYNTPASTVTLGHTILGQNANNENFLFKWEDCRGTIGGIGFNLVHAYNNCVVSAGNSLLGFSPELDFFGNHGGPTKTYSLKSSSWAIENGNPDNCKADTNLVSSVDQRGYSRFADGNNDSKARCDIGAYEYNAPVGVPACVGKPTAPQLNMPFDGSKIQTQQAGLFFSSSCQTSYRVVVREGSKQGPKVDSVKNLTMDSYLTAKLEQDQTYFWRVQACNASGCTKSAWQSFSIKP